MREDEGGPKLTTVANNGGKDGNRVGGCMRGKVVLDAEEGTETENQEATKSEEEEI